MFSSFLFLMHFMARKHQEKVVDASRKKPEE
jgi:hypothetical protein